MKIKNLLLILTALSLALYQSPQEAPKSEIQRLYEEYNKISLDTSKGFGVKNVTFTKDALTVTLEEGALIFSNKIGDQLWAGVYLGKGKMTIDVPEPIKDMQFKQALWQENKTASEKGVKEQEFTEAFFYFTQEYHDLLTGKTIRPDSAVAVIEKGELAQKYSAQAQKIYDLNIGHPEWRELPVYDLVYKTLNGLSTEDFFFTANTKDFKWVGFAYSPDQKRECGAGTRKYELYKARQFMRWQGGVSFDKKEDYRGKEDWIKNLRKRILEDTREAEVVHYDIDATVRKDGLILFNNLKFQFKPLKPNLRCVLFSFPTYTDDLTRRSYTIRKLEDTEGKPLSYFHDFDVLFIDFEKPLQMGKTYTVAIDYEAKFIKARESFIRPPYMSPDEWERFLKEANLDFLPGPSSTFTLLTGDYWMPSVGGMENTVTYNLTFRVPEPYMALSSGETLKRWSEDGYACIQAKTEGPVQIFGILFGRYNMTSGKLYDTEDPSQKEFIEKYGNPTIGVYALDRQREMASVILSKIRNIVHYYNELFGIPYKDKELDLAQMSFFVGFGQAPAGYVQLTGDAFLKQTEMLRVGGLYTTTALNAFISHELAHQWWPHITGMLNYTEDAWLSEAFAEYTSALYIEFLAEQESPGRGKGFETLRDFVQKQWYDGIWTWDIKDLKPEEEGSVYSSQISMKTYTVQTYMKGPYVLHMLRNILGYDLFMQTLRRFLNDFTGKQPTTPDFIEHTKKMVVEYGREKFAPYAGKTMPPDVMEEYVKLTAFYQLADDWFEDWYMDAGHAKIRFSHSVEKNPDGEYILTGRVKQEPSNFKLVCAPVSVFEKDKRISVFHRWVDKPDYEFKVKLPSKPDKIVFDEFSTLCATVTIESAPSKEKK